MNRFLPAVTYLFLGAIFAVAQHPANFEPSSPAPQRLSSPQIDLAKVQAGVSSAYYHPDELSGMDCGVVIGWADVFKQLHREIPPDRLKMLDGMNIEMHARRNKPTEVAVTWANGEPANKQTLEDNAKQMVRGFFQMYWPIFGSSMGPAKTDTVHAEVRDGGGYTLHAGSTTNAVTTEEVDSDLIPVKVYVNSPAMKVQMIPHFTPAPNAKPGDLRWLSRLDTTYEIGTTTITGNFGVDYQTIGGFHVPKRISTSVGGAYVVPLDLIGCSVSREITVAPPPK